MRRRTTLILVVMTCALLITSCKSSSKSKVTTLPAKVSAPVTAAATTAPAPTSASGTPIPPPPPATSAPTAPTAPTSPSPSGSPTPLDPCQLVTQGEASTLAGATFGPGKEESTGGGKECVYGSQTTNVMDIFVAQAPNAATAQAAYAQAQADVETTIASNLPPGVTANLSTDTATAAGIGDEAATITGAASIQGQTISFTGIYVLSSATFFTIGDLVLAKAPPTVTALQDQAKVTLGRI